MKYLIARLLIVSIICLMYSCNKSEPLVSPEECLDMRFESYNIDNQECIYYELYEYKSNYYTLWHCCTCNYISFPIDCNGEALCDSAGKCLDHFLENAEFLFYFTAVE